MVKCVRCKKDLDKNLFKVNKGNINKTCSICLERNNKYKLKKKEEKEKGEKEEKEGKENKKEEKEKEENKKEEEEETTETETTETETTETTTDNDSDDEKRDLEIKTKNIKIDNSKYIIETKEEPDHIKIYLDDIKREDEYFKNKGNIDIEYLKELNAFYINCFFCRVKLQTNNLTDDYKRLNKIDKNIPFTKGNTIFSCHLCYKKKV